MSMDEDRFWALIDDTVVDDQDAQMERLAGTLRKLSADEVRAFNQAYRAAHIEAYRWKLWAAAYVINGGASDDGFHYFCDWLIAQGQDVYRAALDDPDSLADHVEEADAEFEEFGYVAWEVYEEMTDEELPSDDSLTYPPEPKGRPWEEDEVESVVPRLAAHIEDMDD